MEEYARKAIVAVPVLGWPVIKDVFFWFLDNYAVEPLFLILTKWGVFTSIDWKNNEIYEAYLKEATRLMELQGTKEEWNAEDRLRFKNAARSLIRFNLRS